MTFKSAIWYPVAVALGVINLVGFGFAVRAAEPMHAAVHAGLALAAGFWARRLRRGRGGTAREARLDVLEAEVSRLREQLSEAQERLDFAERLLARGPESRPSAPRDPS
jgi:hypothetical protein